MAIASEAQHVMTLSLNKIVQSRNRRGGVNLHRNLLIAGVLFKARDILVAEQSRPATVTVSAPVAAVLPQPVVVEQQTATAGDEPFQMVPDIDDGFTSSPETENASEYVELQSDFKENVPPPTSTSLDVLPVEDRDVVERRASKRRNSDLVDITCSPAKSAKLEPEVEMMAGDDGDDLEEEMDTDAAVCPSVDCVASQRCVTSSTGSGRTRRKSASPHRVCSGPVVCLSRIERLTTNCSQIGTMESLVPAPIFIAQSV